MQDDTKRTTVEDQELADMIANLNGTAPAASPAGPAPAAPAPVDPAAPAPAPDPSAPLPPLPPQPTTPAPDTALPPLPPLPSAPDPVAPSITDTPEPPTAPEGADFNIPDPTPGLTPLPSAGTPLPDLPAEPAQPAEEEKFEPPVSTLPPLGQKTPLPPLPTSFDSSNDDDEEDPDADIDEIGKDFPEPSVKPRKPVSVSSGDSDLSSIKQDALDELRPLVDKLDLPAQEKFDTLLLLIRSNDDKSLITQAYEAAEAIEDETARAAALLDVVKEIDYFEAA